MFFGQVPRKDIDGFGWSMTMTSPTWFVVPYLVCTWLAWHEDISKNKPIFQEIQKVNSKHENEIENLKQIFQELIEENNQKLKAENDAYLKQKDEKIKSLEEEIRTVNKNLN